MFRLNLGPARECAGTPVRFNFREELPAIDGPDGEIRLLDPVEAEVTVTFVDGRYWLHGIAHGRVELACARCLAPFPYAFEVSLDKKYVQGQFHGGEAVVVDGDLLDFTDRVTEAILLALPMRALCHAECRGLCPRCGRPLNEDTCDCRTDEIDPRLAGLAKLLKPDLKGVE